MVKQIKNKRKNYYICESCGFIYKDKETAQKCQDWCKKHNSCNLEITKNAINVR